METHGIRIKGNVLRTGDGSGIAALQVEAWESGGEAKHPVAIAETGDRGQFQMALDKESAAALKRKKALLFFRVMRDGALLVDTYTTINDVIVHLHYTARDGGAGFRGDVEADLSDSLNKIADIKLRPICSIRSRPVSDGEALPPPSSARPP